MKYVNEVFPEFKSFAKLFKGEKNIIKDINKTKLKVVKDISRLNEKTVIKLRDYNFMRFFLVLRQMDIILHLQDEEQYTLSESLGEMTNPNSLTDIFYSELELFDLVKANKLNLNTNVGSKGFDFFLGKYIYGFLERNIDLDVLRYAVSIFTNDVDLASIEKEVMKIYNATLNGPDRFNLGSEYFKDMKYIINLFFTSNVEDFYIKDSEIKPYEDEFNEKKSLKMPEINEKNSKNDKTKPTITSTINKDKER